MKSLASQLSSLTSHARFSRLSYLHCKVTFGRAETDANNLVSRRPAYLQLPKHILHQFFSHYIGSVSRIENDFHILFFDTGLPLLSRLRHSLSFVKPALPDLYCASFLDFHELLRSVYSMSDEVLFSPLSSSNSARSFPRLIYPVLTVWKGASPANSSSKPPVGIIPPSLPNSYPPSPRLNKLRIC